MLASGSDSRFCAHLGTFLPKTLSPPCADYCNIVTGVKSPATAMFEQINTQKSPQRDPMVRV